MNINRIAAAAFLLGSAVAANAVSLDLISAGTYDTSVAGGYTTAEKVILQVTAPVLPALSTFDFAATYVGVGGTGSATYLSADLLNGFTINFNLDSFVLAGDLLTSSTKGDWTYAGGIGSYAGYTGQGTLSASYNSTGTTAYTTVVGHLDAVPEPASFAVVGLGLVGLVGRRRRK